MNVSSGPPGYTGTCGHEMCTAPNNTFSCALGSFLGAILVPIEASSLKMSFAAERLRKRTLNVTFESDLRHPYGAQECIRFVMVICHMYVTQLLCQRSCGASPWLIVGHRDWSALGIVGVASQV